MYFKQFHLFLVLIFIMNTYYTTLNINEKCNVTVCSVTVSSVTILSIDTIFHS